MIVTSLLIHHSSLPDHSLLTTHQAMISIVIPVCNEKESLEILLAEIDAVGRDAKLDLEVLFVDDGSTDGSWNVIRKLAQKNGEPGAPPPTTHHSPLTTHHSVRGLRFRRNFGKAAALSAGFRHARGALVFTLDGDLQDDPKAIPLFLVAMEKGLDVVSGWKRVRHDPWHKVFPSRIFNFLVSWLTGVWLHDHNSGMKCYRAEIFREIRLYGELHRFIPVLAAARGYKVGEIEINHRPRRFGHSKYGVHRFVKGFLDLLTVKFLTGFGQRPQHLLGTIGLASFALGALGMVFLSITWLINLAQPGTF